MWEVVYEGDRLTLFGTLTYDTSTDQASFDETVSMMASSAKEAISKKLNWDYTKEVFKVAGYASLALIFIVCAGKAVSVIHERLRKLRLEADHA